jgi:hypothetical protein
MSYHVLPSLNMVNVFLRQWQFSKRVRRSRLDIIVFITIETCQTPGVKSGNKYYL